MIRFENALNNPACMQQLQRLYREAFPPEEQAPLFFLKAKARRGKCDMLGVYEGETFVGLAILVRHEDLMYVFFLAVEDELRGAGRGTAILAEIAWQHPGVKIMLAIEDPEEPCDNLPIRLRRKAFYRRCGYEEAGFRVHENGVVYEMLATSPVTYDDYQRLMTVFMGKVLFRIVHRQKK